MSRKMGTGNDSDDDGYGGGGAGGAFALLAEFEDMNLNRDEEWEQVVTKKDKKKTKAKVDEPAPALRTTHLTSSARASSNATASRPSVSSIGAGAASRIGSALAQAAPSTSSSSSIIRAAAQSATSRARITHGPDGRPIGQDYYKAFQKCYREPQTGDVVLKFHKTDIVRIKPNGDIVLNTGGYYTLTTLLSMNDALCHIGVKVTKQGEIGNGDWAIVDGYGSHTFTNGMTVSARSAEDKDRGQTVLEGVIPEIQQYAPSSSYTASTVSRASAPQARATPQPAASSSQQQPREVPGATFVSATASGSGSWAARLAASNYQAQYARQVAQQQQLQQQQQQGWGTSDTGTSTSYRAAGPADFVVATANLKADHFEAFLGEDAALMDDDHFCVVCMEAERDTMLLPCGHAAMCMNCAINIMETHKECPLCRLAIIDVLKLEME